MGSPTVGIFSMALFFIILAPLQESTAMRDFDHIVLFQCCGKYHDALLYNGWLYASVLGRWRHNGKNKNYSSLYETHSEQNDYLLNNTFPCNFGENDYRFEEKRLLLLRWPSPYRHTEIDR
mmetsp:Transcript_13293/g.19555  ORF Transcript_13293/g.19555 Transcript_13293/m.19555 type:complete len:121 (+) Transcript_13293:1876-2238(+)